MRSLHETDKSNPFVFIAELFICGESIPIIDGNISAGPTKSLEERLYQSKVAFKRLFKNVISTPKSMVEVVTQVKLGLTNPG